MFFNNLIPVDALHVKGALGLAANASSEASNSCCVRPVAAVYGVTAVVFSSLNVALYTLRGCYRFAANILYLHIASAVTELIYDLGNAALSLLSTAFGVVCVVVGLIYPSIYQKISPQRDGTVNKLQSKMQSNVPPSSSRNETTSTPTIEPISPTSPKSPLSLEPTSPTSPKSPHPITAEMPPLDQLKAKTLNTISSELMIDETSPRKKNEDLITSLKSEQQHVTNIPPFVLSDGTIDRNSPLAQLRTALRRLKESSVSKDSSFIGPEYDAVKAQLDSMQNVNLPWQPLPDNWLDDYFNGTQDGKSVMPKIQKERVITQVDTDFNRFASSSRRIDLKRTQGTIAAQTLSYLTTTRSLSETQALEVLSLMHQGVSTAHLLHLTNLFDAATQNRLTALCTPQSSPHEILLMNFLDTTDKTIQILFTHLHKIQRQYNNQTMIDEPPLAIVTGFTWINYSQRKVYVNWKVNTA